MMGIYYRATTIIGYELSTANFREQLDKTKPFEGAKKKDVYWGFSDEFLNHLPPGYVSETLYDEREDKLWFGYGSRSESEDDTKLLPPKSYGQIKADIADLLKPYIQTGFLVLDESKFGIWTIYAGH